MIKFPPHKCSLTIRHNPHLDYYQTAKDYLDDDAGGRPPRNACISPEEYEQCCETGEVWELQWYPNTPIGFHALIASTLDAVLDAANSGDDT